MTWIDANRSAFAVPVRLGRRTRKYWQISFDGIMPNVSAVLIGIGSQNELVIAAYWQGECWDLFVSFEASPIRKGAAYFCELCEENHRRAFGSRQEIWLDHLFMPFLDWVNNMLAPANWLVLDNYDGATSAMLSVERPSDEIGRIVIPLHNKMAVRN